MRRKSSVAFHVFRFEGFYFIVRRLMPATAECRSRTQVSGEWSLYGLWLGESNSFNISYKKRIISQRISIREIDFRVKASTKSGLNFMFFVANLFALLLYVL